MANAKSKTLFLVGMLPLLLLSISGCAPVQTLPSDSAASSQENASRREALIEDVMELRHWPSSDDWVALDGSEESILGPRSIERQARKFLEKYSIEEYYDVLLSLDARVGVTYSYVESSQRQRPEGIGLFERNKFGAGCYLINRMLFQIEDDTAWPYVLPDYPYTSGAVTLIAPWEMHEGRLRLQAWSTIGFRRHSSVYDPLAEFRLFSILYPLRDRKLLASSQEGRNG